MVALLEKGNLSSVEMCFGKRFYVHLCCGVKEMCSNLFLARVWAERDIVIVSQYPDSFCSRVNLALLY